MTNLYSTYLAQVTNCKNGTDNPDCFTNLPEVDLNHPAVTNILGIVFGVMGAVAVLIIVIQAIKFALSNGEADKAASARKGIIYALVGLVISLTAEAIVLTLIKKL